MSETQVVRASHGEKAETVAAIHQRLKSAKMAIVTEYRGLSVAQMTRLRREIREASGEYQVIKNTLVRRALEDTVFGDLEKLARRAQWLGLRLRRSGGVVQGADQVRRRQRQAWRSRAAFSKDASWIPAGVKVLSQMPSKPELQAKLLAMINAPATQLVRLIQEPGARTVRLLESVRKIED